MKKYILFTFLLFIFLPRTVLATMYTNDTVKVKYNIDESYWSQRTDDGGWKGQCGTIHISTNDVYKTIDTSKDNITRSQYNYSIINDKSINSIIYPIKQTATINKYSIEKYQMTFVYLDYTVKYNGNPYNRIGYMTVNNGYVLMYIYDGYESDECMYRVKQLAELTQSTVPLDDSYSKKDSTLNNMAYIFGEVLAYAGIISLFYLIFKKIDILKYFKKK